VAAGHDAREEDPGSGRQAAADDREGARKEAAEISEAQARQSNEKAAARAKVQDAHNARLAALVAKGEQYLTAAPEMSAPEAFDAGVKFALDALRSTTTGQVVSSTDRELIRQDAAKHRPKAPTAKTVDHFKAAVDRIQADQPKTDDREHD
jgi:hypothetical protein